MSLLKSREYCYMKVINNIFCFACVLSKEPADWKLIIESIQQLNAELSVEWISSVNLYSLEHLALMHMFIAFLTLSVKSVAISLFMLQVWNG